MRLQRKAEGLVRVIVAVSIFYMIRLTFHIQAYITQPLTYIIPSGWAQLSQIHHDAHSRPVEADIGHFWKFNGVSRQVTVVSCSALLEGDKTIGSFAKQYSKNHPRKALQDKKFIHLTQNCTEFKLRRGYILKPMSKEEEEFPIAYSILFYKELQVLERLLRAIYRPQNVYCLHLDKDSSDILYLSVQSLVRCFDNVFLASKLEDVVYTGVSRLQADINCMADVIDRHKHWKYYINLASQNFPLKTNEQIVKILKIYNGSNDIEGMGKTRLLRGRFRNEWHIVTKRPRGKPFINKTSILKATPPMNIKIVRGSAYGVFSRAFVDFIINSKYSKSLLEWSKDTYSPDEHFWATLHHISSNPHLNTPGGYKGKTYFIHNVYGSLKQKLDFNQLQPSPTAD